MASVKDPSIYAIVVNIPSTYHSCDLRNYFSQFLETGGFQCFHFRHRPEEKKIKESSSTSRDLPSVQATQLPQTDASVFKVPIGIPGCSKHKVKVSSVESTTKTLCCIIKLTEKSLRRLKEMYHRKHWLHSNGESLTGLCMISKIKISDDADSGANKYKTRGEMKKIPANRETFTNFDLLSLAELHPPEIMPQGNVGTPTQHFLKLIQQCKLPPGIIKRLGLTFPKTRGRRIYASVGYDYGGKVVHTEQEEEVVKSASGREIEREGETLGPIPRPGSPDSPGEETPDSGEDDDGGEEWERHESLNDDPANVERNKERLYEEEMEVTWEKGGPGLVWYTDASFWKQKEGDFDEQTSDDWDVDTSVYYDPQGGDKDARDFVELRLHKRRREGLEQTDRFSCGIGKFEQHTRGIGRKVMETQGWREGQGLGSSVPGISDALEGDGQVPTDRRGFGYHGEKVNRYGVNKKPRQDGQFFVSTVYDNPADTDPKDDLLRRKNPHNMTYRNQAMRFIKGGVIL